MIDTFSTRGHPTLRLIGYTLTPDGYQLLAPDERGWLGIEDNEIVCYDENGQPLGDCLALANALRDAEQRAADAERRASAEIEARAAAEAQVCALEAELRRLRGN